MEDVTHDESQLPLALTATGIGGQGIQLLCRTLALAATNAGLHAMLAAEYGGEMRGGPSAASVVLDRGPVRSLPVLERTDAAIVSHHRFSERTIERQDPDGLCLVNSSVVDPVITAGLRQVIQVPAADLAKELGAPQASGFVLLGAFSALTGVVGIDALAAAMRTLLPPYRQAAAPSNERALAIGAHAVADRSAQPIGATR